MTATVSAGMSQAGKWPLDSNQCRLADGNAAGEQEEIGLQALFDEFAEAGGFIGRNWQKHGVGASGGNHYNFIPH